MVDRLIQKVRVKRKKSGFATYTEKQHHGISDDLLSRKWEIGIDKAKWSLQYITQENVRSALKSLTRQYRTYLLSQRISQLNFRFIQTLYLQRNNT